MDFNSSLNCISYREPLLWISLIVGSAIGWFAARLLIVTFQRFKLAKLSAVLIVAALGALPAAVLSSFILLAVLYVVIRHGIVCIHFVRPAFLLPASIAVFSVLCRTSIASHAD